MMQTVFPMKYEPVPNQIRKFVLERDHSTCQKCHIKFSENKLEIHHKIPVRMGGNHLLENLITLCRKCHKIIEPGRSLKYAYRANGDKVSVQLDKETVKILQSVGKYGDTYDSIIRRLIGAPQKQKKEVVT